MRQSLAASLALLLPALAGSSIGWAQYQPPGLNPIPTVVQPLIEDRHSVLMPQLRHIGWQGHMATISAVAADIKIEDQVATTVLEISVTNPSGAGQEAEILLPVPDGVTIRALQYDGTGPEPTAKILPKDEARRIYNSIVHASRDPALLEFAGLNVIRTSAFPIPAGATQKIRITFEQLLTSDAGRIEYVLPKSESLATGAGVPWTIKATIKNAGPLATVYSPSHDLASERKGAGEYAVTVPAASASGPGSFRLCALTPQDAKSATATLYAYPDASLEGGKGGYFLMVAALPGERPADLKPTPREITLVLDRSGSMQGEKFQQAQKAALNIVNGMLDGERLNIIDYSDSIETFAKEPVVIDEKTRKDAAAYVGRLAAVGGTNINDAMAMAMTQPAAPNLMPITIFLTDGLPTVGERSEVAIRNNVKAANKASRRIFTFGVGHDVNTPLLSALARGSKGAPTFVLPQEDIEIKVSQVYRRLRGPTLANATLVAIDAEGNTTTRAMRDLQPSGLDDIFEGDQIVVLGQYTGESDTLKVKLGGEYFGAARSFEFSMKLGAASPKHGFVPRLWATRKVAKLIDEIRQASVENASSTGEDARTKELVDQITALSTRWGIVTPYTSFLATEPTLAYDANGWTEAVRERLTDANSTRAGELSLQFDGDITTKLSSVNAQSSNSTYTPSSVPHLDLQAAGGRVAFYSLADSTGADKSGRLTFNAIQNINAQTYYYRQTGWIDGRALAKESEKPEVEVIVGTPEFDAVVDTLIQEGQTGALALDGNILVVTGGKRTLIRREPAPAEPPAIEVPAPTPTPAPAEAPPPAK